MLRRLLLVTVVALACAPPASAQGPAQDMTLTMSDGTPLACTLWQAQGVEVIRVPAVILFHGLGGKRQDMAPFAEALSSAGYESLACDARGHGASGGLFGLDGPRDVQDTRELYDWLASQGGVNDQAIGALGVSLGGGAVWNAAAAGIPFKAIVPIITWTDLQEALAPQGLAKSGLVLYLSQLVPQARFDPTLLGALPALLSGGDLTQVAQIAAARSVGASLPRLAVPTFLVQGRHDFLFDIDQALAAYRALAGPKRLYLGDLGHAPAPNPPRELPYLEQQIRIWFDHWLKGSPGTGAPVSLAADPWNGKVATYRTLPATRRVAFSLPGRTTIAQGGKVVRSVRLRSALETFGDASVSFAAAGTGGWDHVVAVLSYGGTVVSEGGARLTGGGTLRIRLLDEAVRIPRGARLTLTLAATSTAQAAANLLYARDVPPGARLTVGKAALSLSVLKKPVSR